MKNSLTKIYRFQNISYKRFFNIEFFCKLYNFVTVRLQKISRAYLKTNQDYLTVVSFKTALRLKHTLF